MGLRSYNPVYPNKLINCKTTPHGPVPRFAIRRSGITNVDPIVGFSRGGCSRVGCNWGTLRIPRGDWGTLGNIRED